MNAKSATKTETMGMSDHLPNIIWARMFIEAQEYPINENIICQENQSAMKIEAHGK